MYPGSAQLQHLSLVIRAINVTSCNRCRPTWTQGLPVWSPAGLPELERYHLRSFTHSVTQYGSTVLDTSTLKRDWLRNRSTFEFAREFVRGSGCVRVFSLAGQHLGGCRGKWGTRYRQCSRWPGPQPAPHGPPPSYSASAQRRSPGWPPPHTGCTSNCCPAHRSRSSAASEASPWSRIVKTHTAIRDGSSFYIRWSKHT